MLPYELLIGLRYTRAGRYAKTAAVQRLTGSAHRPLSRNRFISFISGLATVGIALGVAALIVVLSVMNGFQKEVRDRMLGVLSHIEVIQPGRDLASVTLVLPELLKHNEVVAAAPFVAAQAMISKDGQMKGVMVRGIDPNREPTVSPSLAKLVNGQLASLSARQFNVVLGRALAGQLGVSVGDTVVMISADGVVSPAGITPRLRQFTVSGLFSSGHFEYELFFRDQGISGIRLMLKDMQRAPDVAISLSARLPREFVVRDWAQENRNWFAAVQVEKRMMFIILTLIIAVAAFNLVSMLVMTVTDKRSDIAILRTLGAQRRSIMAIFMVQGAWLGFLGVVLGVSFGVVIAANIDIVMATLEGLFGFQVLPQGIYFIDRLPSDLRWPDVLQIGVIALFLSLLATVYPSWSASRLEPAEALRYE
jgi:lipoprotein-releasing system permease protein